MTAPSGSLQEAGLRDPEYFTRRWLALTFDMASAAVTLTGLASACEAAGRQGAKERDWGAGTSLLCSGRAERQRGARNRPRPPSTPRSKNSSVFGSLSLHAFATGKTCAGVQRGSKPTSNKHGDDDDDSTTTMMTPNRRARRSHEDATAIPSDTYMRRRHTRRAPGLRLLWTAPILPGVSGAHHHHAPPSAASARRKPRSGFSTPPAESEAQPLRPAPRRDRLRPVARRHQHRLTLPSDKRRPIRPPPSVEP